MIMRIIKEFRESNRVIVRSVGEIETRISSIDLIYDLRELNSIKSFEELGLLISRKWSL